MDYLKRYKKRFLFINNSLFLLQNKPVDDYIPDKPLVPQVLQLHAHSFGIPT